LLKFNELSFMFKYNLTYTLDVKNLKVRTYF
jgi:hypothetical protein